MSELSPHRSANQATQDAVDHGTRVQDHLTLRATAAGDDLRVMICQRVPRTARPRAPKHEPIDELIVAHSTRLRVVGAAFAQCP